MLSYKKIAILTLVLLITLVAPAKATDYNPGVTTGQWAKYGNVTVVGSFPIPDANNTDWMKIEVTDVSGKNLTLHMSGQYKNGTAATEFGLACNIETGWNNMSASGGNFYVIAANLQEDDIIPELFPMLIMKVNTTATRTYFGTDRTVNIINTTWSYPSVIDYSFLMIYDKASGMLMEMNMSIAYYSSPSMSMTMSFNITDTNIFGSTDYTIYIAAAIIIIIIVAAAAIMLTRKKKSPTSTETPTET